MPINNPGGSDGSLSQSEMIALMSQMAPVQHATPVAEGATVAMVNDQANHSVLLDPSGPRTLVNVTQPQIPRDGQVITVGSTRPIAEVRFSPAVASSPGSWDAGDVYQFKWFDGTADWKLLK